MQYIFANQTTQPQQICCIDGSAITVQPLCEAEVDEFKIYKEEFERAKKFFKVTLIEPKEPPRRFVGKSKEPNIDSIEEVD